MILYVTASIIQLNKITETKRFYQEFLSGQNCAVECIRVLTSLWWNQQESSHSLPSYHTVKAARLLPHCASQQKGHFLLMLGSWKWVTAPCHVADLYTNGTLCSGAKEHGFPNSFDIQRCYHESCSHQIEGNEQICALTKTYKKRAELGGFILRGIDHMAHE